MNALNNNQLEKYEAEAKEKWGNTQSYQQYQEKTKDYSKEKWNILSEEMNQILAGLGQMYVGDERFTQNIDKFGAGTAAFMAAAIEMYCRRDNI